MSEQLALELEPEPTGNVRCYCRIPECAGGCGGEHEEPGDWARARLERMTTREYPA